MDQVRAFCSDHDVDVIVPTWEEAFYLSTLRERLEDVAASTPLRSRRSPACTTSTPSRPWSSGSESRRPWGDGAQRRRASGGRRPLAALLRPGRLLARRGHAPHEHGTARRPRAAGGRASHARCAVARAGVRGRADGVHLQHPPRRAGSRGTAPTGRRASTTTAPPCSSRRSPARKRWRSWSASARSSATPARCHSTSWTRATGSRIIECNPRTTDGALLMESDELAGSLLDPDQELVMVPPGRADATRPRGDRRDVLRRPARGAGVDPRPAPDSGSRPRLARSAAQPLLVPGLLPPRAAEPAGAREAPGGDVRGRVVGRRADRRDDAGQSAALAALHEG